MKTAKVTNFSVILIWIVVLFLAILSRLYDLGNKPLHFDEGINGWFVMQMDVAGFYKYDPSNYHGPLYFYLVWLFEALWGRSVEVLRLVPAVFSIFSVMIFSFGVLASKALQRWMMFFLLVSPAFIFFGRSGIHEMPFVFFQLVTVLGILRYFEKTDGKSLGLVIVGIWGMATLKETFAITVFCMALGLASLGWTRLRTWFSWSKLRQAGGAGLATLSLLLVFIFALLFTGFLKNPSGLWDFVKAFLPWMKTGVHGNGHDKSFFYWVQVLWQAEPLVLLGVLLAIPGAFSKEPALRFLSVFSLAQFLVYSFIPYKTVWCVLSLVWGFYFVLAYYVSRGIYLKWIAVIPLLWGLRSAYLSSYKNPIWMDHPYVYVNSSYDLKSLFRLILEKAHNNPDLLQQPVQIGMAEQWPWPWLMRSFKNIDYNYCAKKVAENALVYFCEEPDASQVEASLGESYWKLRLSLRYGRFPALIYLKKSVFTEMTVFPNAETVKKED